MGQKKLDAQHGGNDFYSITAQIDAQFSDIYGRLAAVQTATVPAGSAVALTTATPANVTSLQLLPGIYLIWGFIDATLAGATLTALIASLSLNSGAFSSQAGGSGLGTDPTKQQLASLVTATGTTVQDAGPTTLTVAVPTTLYLVAQAAFSAGTVSAYGSIFAKPLFQP